MKKCLGAATQVAPCHDSKSRGGIMVELAVCLAFLLPATAACLYHVALTLAGIGFPIRLRGFRNRPDAVSKQSAPSEPAHSFAVLIPAHNEEATLPAALHSLTKVDYPPEKLRVYVVADNCIDRTAEIAREYAATCLPRTDAERQGKGFAVAFGIEQLVRDEPDAVLILDADCVLSPNAVRALDAAFASGAEVVQAAVRSTNADDGPGGYTAAVGAAVDQALAAGRDRLGWSVPLRGTGMAFRRSVLECVRWATPSPVEDAEYDRQFRDAGIRVHFCGEAVVGCEAPATIGVLCRQRRRWRAAVRSVGWLGSKPLVLAQLLATTVACLAAGAFVWWAAGLVAVTTGLYLRAATEVGWTWHRAGLLASSPGVVLRLVGVTLAGYLKEKPKAWDRTPRHSQKVMA